MEYKDFFLNLPTVCSNKVFFSCVSQEKFIEDNWWVEYPTLTDLKASPGKLTEAYFPLCLALSSLENVKIHLPVKIDEEVIKNWVKAIEIAGTKLFLKKPNVLFQFDSIQPEYLTQQGNRTALFFGGGTESLLTLAQLNNKGIKPILVSIGGENWAGSNPKLNQKKFELDELISKELNLELLQVRTNFRQVICSDYWTPHLKPNVSLINTLLALPSYLSFIFPVCEQLSIGSLANGNELMNFPDEYFCFSPEMTFHLKHVALNVTYESYLSTLLKEEVCHELYRHYPHLAKYQYSCWKNLNQRWCYKCQSCLQYYVLLKLNGLDPKCVNLEEPVLWSNMKQLISIVAKSPEGRRGEIWERLILHPRLKRDPQLNKILQQIKLKALFYQYYKPMPQCLRQFYRAARWCYWNIAKLFLRYLLLFKEAFQSDCWNILGNEKQSGHPIHFHYVGLERHKNYFVRAACQKDFKEEYMGKLWLSGIENRVKKSHPLCSFIVFELGGWKRFFFWNKTCFKIPVWIQTVINIPESLEDFRKNNRFRSVRRRIHKYNLSCEISKDEKQFDKFYSDMYVPYALKRHGNTVFLENYHHIKELWKNGELLLLKKDQKYIGGELVHYTKKIGKIDILGICDSEEDYVEMGAIGALLYYSLCRIREKGYKTADIGYSRSFIKDGALQNKFSYGAEFKKNHHPESGYLTFKLLNLDVGTKNFFLFNPFISKNRAGRYEVVTFFEDLKLATKEHLNTWIKDHHCSGLKELTLYFFRESGEPNLKIDLNKPFGQTKPLPAELLLK